MSRKSRKLKLVHRPGRHLGTTKVWKKDENHNRSGRIDGCRYKHGSDVPTLGLVVSFSLTMVQSSPSRLWPSLNFFMKTFLSRCFPPWITTPLTILSWPRSTWEGEHKRGKMVGILLTKVAPRPYWSHCSPWLDTPSSIFNPPAATRSWRAAWFAARSSPTAPSTSGRFQPPIPGRRTTRRWSERRRSARTPSPASLNMDSLCREGIRRKHCWIRNFWKAYSVIRETTFIFILSLL